MDDDRDIHPAGAGENLDEDLEEDMDMADEELGEEADDDEVM